MIGLGWILMLSAVNAGDPPSESRGAAPAPGGSACPGSQRCGDHCIAWTEPCRQELAASAGIAAPPTATGVTPVPPNVPPGSSLLNAPALVEPGRPRMKPGAPAWCTDGASNPWLMTNCLPFYETGAGAGSSPTSADPSCPIHRRCAGACLAEGEVCPSPGVQEQHSDRLTPLGG